MQEYQEVDHSTTVRLVKIYESIFTMRMQYNETHSETKDRDLAHGFDSLLDSIQDFASSCLNDHLLEEFSAAVEKGSQGRSEQTEESSTSPEVVTSLEKNAKTNKELKAQLESCEEKIARLEQELERSKMNHELSGSMAAIQSPRNIDDVETLRRYVLEARELLREKDEEIEELHSLMLEQRVVLEREMSSKMKVMLEDLTGRAGDTDAVKDSVGKNKKGKISAARYEEMASENARLKMQIQELRNVLSSTTRRSNNFLSGGAAKVCEVQGFQLIEYENEEAMESQRLACFCICFSPAVSCHVSRKPLL
eukprot:764483-Hanusia_phi.AAC.2